MPDFLLSYCYLLRCCTIVVALQYSACECEVHVDIWCMCQGCGDSL